MARYQIWNKTDNIITPIGEVLTPAKWIERYPMAKTVDIVIGGGVINGTVCMEYTNMVDTYKRMGVDFSECIEKQDFLDAIEAWEDSQSDATSTVNDSQRIADALEDLVVLNMPNVE